MTNETAILAGGCFWGMQDLIRKLPGVTHTRVGYSGGDLKNPGYRDVSTGKTGHAESIKIDFDPEIISYRKLLEFFFQIHDPTTLNRQGNDVGTQYRSAIFTLSKEQQITARDLISELEQSDIWPSEIMTKVEPAGEFYDAEDNHQDYLETYPEGYTCHFIRPDWKLS
ncbi:MAG: peptide-methionine (S)-S-oxide reductase MsrA [Pseudomonadota bacterium]